MTVPWHRKKPYLLREVREDVERYCGTLHLFVNGDQVVIRGTFPVRHKGEELDRYAITITFPPDYPDGLPAVREVGGRIPWIGDHHVYTSGVACVILPEARWWEFPPNTPFFVYLRGPLHNYFLGQTVVASGKPWPFGEHRHGLDGIMDFYAEQLGTNDAKMIVRLLESVASGECRGHLPCPCGSGTRTRDCHPRVIAVAQEMPPRAARKSLDNIFWLAENEERQQIAMNKAEQR